jgi:hypothetical protein
VINDARSSQWARPLVSDAGDGGSAITMLLRPRGPSTHVIDAID